MERSAAFPVQNLTITERRGIPRRAEDIRLLRKEREMAAAHRMSEALFQHMTTDQLVMQALQTILEVVEAESGSILLANPDTRELIFRHSIGASPVHPGTAIPWDQGIAGEVFRSGLPIVIEDASADPRHCTTIDALTGHRTRDMIALPLKRWEGAPIGVLEVLNRRDGRLSDEDLSILAIVSSVTATSIEQARLFQESKLAEVARVVGNIGHDIKNLLMPVVCGTGLLEGEIKDLLKQSPAIDPTKAQASFELCNEVIDMVRKSTQRIQNHVKEIGDCVKGLSAPPEFAILHIAPIVSSVFDTLRWVAQDRHVALIAQQLDQLPPLVADEHRLFNLFYNLLNNAIPETPSGGSVTVSGTAKEDSCLHIAVADTGRGMAPDIRDRLFTSRAKSTKTCGTGLGTKIVRDVIDAHGGSITVTSTVGVGTTFFITLPLRPPGA